MTREEQITHKEVAAMNKEREYWQQVRTDAAIAAMNIVNGAYNIHEVVKAEQPAEPKPRKKRVANGKGDRSEYMKKYYQGQKVRLTEKNHADYIRRKLETDAPVRPLGKRKPLKVGRTCLQCVNYPCFDGIENLESDFANEGCHAFRKREKKQ